MKKTPLVYTVLIFWIVTSYSQTTGIKITGFIKDSKTNEKLIGAVILNEGNGLAVTDSSGYFSFKLKPGKYLLECKYIGYESSVKEISLGQDGEEFELFFYLQPKPIEIEKVTISGERYKEINEFKTYELRSGDLSNIPVFLESDALRALQALPGITSVHDFSAQIYLRGGNYDETLIALDGVPIYNPYHIGGIFGSVNPDIVDREIIYPSNYPVNYHGVLSGVVSINTKNGNSEKIKGIGSVGLLSSKLFLEGPLLKGNFYVSARRTYPDLLYNMLVDSENSGKFPYYFYDFSAKYTLPIDAKNLFTVSGFYSRDIYVIFEDRGRAEKKEDPNWGNLIGNFKFNHLFDNGEFELGASYSISDLDSDAKTYHGNYYYTLNGLRDTVEYVYVHNKIMDATIKAKVELNLTGQEILVGAEYKNLSTNYFWNINEHDIGSFINGTVADIFFDFAPDIYEQNDKTEILSAYFSDKIQLTPFFDLMIGYRGVYVQKIRKFLNSPYGKIRYKFNSNLEVSAGYGKYYEYFFTKRELLTQSAYNPFSIYFITDDVNKIPSSDHYSLGIKVKEILPEISLEVEGYYKTRENIFTSDEFTETVSFINGYAAGLDVLLKKEKGTITGWISYALSRTVKYGREYNYFANYDRTHNFKLMLNYNLSERWKLNSLWIYSTGLPLTPIVGKAIRSANYYYNGVNDVDVLYGKKNTDRYGDYHRLDIGITGNFIWWDSIIAKPYLQIMNVYMSKNPFDYKPGSTNTSIEEGQGRASFIIPTIGLTLEF